MTTGFLSSYLAIMISNDGIKQQQRKQPTTLLIILILILIFGVFSIGIYFRLQESTLQLELIPSPKPLSEEELRDRARQGTVRILLDNGSGSGVLIDQDNGGYHLITNQHVIRSAEENTYRVETPDGKVYSAEVVDRIDFAEKDLAILKFQADNQNYETIPLGDSQQVKVGQTVIAAGFPSEQRRESVTKALEINQGEISLLPPQPLEEGYYIGYTNPIQKGMSGGPLLNLKGELIAINGIHAYPIWGDSYIYQNGEQPSKAMRKKMRKFSWAIPSNQFKAKLTQ